MPAHTVLDVGQCDFDHSRISHHLGSHFDVTVVRAHSFEESIKLAGETKFDLVLINRLLDRDQSAGLEILKTLKSNEATSSIPVMLVSNFEDAQIEAVAAGAEQGFGKASLDTEPTTELLKKYLTA